MTYTPKTWTTGETITAAELNAIEQGVAAAVSSVAGRTGAVTLASTDLTDSTATGQALVEAASAAAARTALGLGTAATQPTSAFDAAGAAAAAQAASVPLAGGTMTGPLILNANPTGPLGAATRQYADGAGVFLTVKTFGTAGDVKTLTDGAITAGSANFTAASGTFVSGDIGKTIVVPQAGAINSTTTLSAALTTGAAITSLPVNTTTAITPVGPVVITSGANVQAFYNTASAPVGSTSLTVTSQTPSFAFPIGSTVATPAHSLITTISAVGSATSITLAATATNTVTGAETVYGTDDTTALQNAINAAQTARAGLYVAPPTGEGYLITSALTISAHLRMFGSGVTETWGSAIGTGADPLNFPVAVPHFLGSVFVVAAENTDGLKITAAGANANLDDIGIRFAGLFRFTGHGFNALPPADGANYDNGLMSSTILRCKVFGHDGDHYAFNIVNSEYCTFFNLRGYGGGGIQLLQQSTRCNCGNALLEHPFFYTTVIGTAHGYHFNQVANRLNLVTLVRPQAWLRSSTYAPAAGLVPVGGTAGQHNVMTSGTSTQVQNITWIAPDMETSVASLCKWPIYNNWIVGQGQLVAGDGNLLNGTVFQNSTAYQNTFIQGQITGTFLLSPTAGAAATVDVYVGASNPPTGGSHVHSLSLPANSPSQLITLSWIVPPGYYHQVNMVNATRSWSFGQTIEG